MMASNQDNSNYISPKNNTKTVRVCIRMRPLLQHEDSEYWSINESSNTIFTSNNYKEKKGDLFSDSNIRSNQNIKDLKRAFMDATYSPQSFSFDKVYSINANSQTIYMESCKDITKSVLDGFNCSVFMYGQTTSGKTFSMLGSPISPGILPCSLKDVFNIISTNPHPENYTVLCSYVEIYNENIHDLLTDANYLKLIDDSKYGVIVAGAKRVRINNFEEGIGIKDYGEENRKYRETLYNEYSSRSHTIFQIFVESVELTQQDEYAKSRFSCLNLVDLAGSERITEYDPKAEGSSETGYINKSLFVLANVINKLAEAKKNYIPYRDSKLTRLLSQALGGKSLTVIICTVSPAAINYYQTLSTLRFGTRAKSVKLKPTPNEFLDNKSQMEYYKNEIKRLRSELENKGGEMMVHPSSLDEYKNPTDYSKYEELANSLPEEQKALISELIKLNQELVNQALGYKGSFGNEREKSIALENKIAKLKLKIKQLKENNKNNALEEGKRNNNIDNKEMISNSNKGKELSNESQIQGGDENKNYQFSHGNTNDINHSTTDKQESDDFNSKMNKEKAKNLYDFTGEDEVIDLIHSQNLFNSIELEYDITSIDNIDDNISNLIDFYKSLLDKLEESFEKNKSYINLFYKKKIKETKNTNMDIVKIPKDQLPITQITNKHNESLKLLRQQHENKKKALEEVSILKSN